MKNEYNLADETLDLLPTQPGPVESETLDLFKLVRGFAKLGGMNEKKAHELGELLVPAIDSYASKKVEEVLVALQRRLIPAELLTHDQSMTDKAINEAIEEVRRAAGGTKG